MGALAAGADGAGSLTLSAPTTPGTYYYGACADAVADETNTANNCSAAVALTVREPPRRPDLAVTATLSESAVEPEESFRLAARVSNQGRGDAPAATLRYYRSSDASISTSDAEEGTDAVGALAAGADGAGSLTLNAPPTPGTYYYGACADAVAEETNTANNCSAAVVLTVREPPPGPDLVVTAMLSDAVVDPGETFSLETAVRNRGGAASAATMLRYYRSSDASISTSDAEEGTDAVGALAAGADGAGSLTLNAPPTPGTYYYGACADAVAEETNTANNCSAAVVLTVREPPPGPDLVVTAMLSDAVVDPGETFSLETAVRNRGGAACGGDDAALLPVVGRHDRIRRTLGCGRGHGCEWRALAAGGGRRRCRVTLNGADGRRARTTTERARTRCRRRRTPSNNCSAAATVTVREPPRRPDLAVAATLSESAVEPEESFRLAARVSNQGRGDAPATMLRYYRSEDGMIAPSDTGLGADGVAALAAGGSETLSRELAAPSVAGHLPLRSVRGRGAGGVGTRRTTARRR